MTRFFFVAGACALLACTPAAPTPAPTPCPSYERPAPCPPPSAPDASPSADASPAPAVTPEGAACANLARLGCAEGADPSCADRVRAGEGITRVDAPCLAAAPTRAAVVRCGFVRCLPEGGI